MLLVGIDFRFMHRNVRILEVYLKRTFVKKRPSMPVSGADDCRNISCKTDFSINFPTLRANVGPHMSCNSLSSCWLGCVVDQHLWLSFQGLFIDALAMFNSVSYATNISMYVLYASMCESYCVRRWRETHVWDLLRCVCTEKCCVWMWPRTQPMAS